MSMTLEQVIADCKEEISDCQIDLDGIQELLEEYPERKEAFAHEIDDYKKRMDYNRQLAEWLKELQERRKADNEIPFGNNAPFSELDSIINAYEIHGNHKKVVELLKELQERRKLPEIVYCKDCKHKGTKNCVANAWTTIFGFGVKDDFYCGLGKRRTDDND